MKKFLMSFALLMTFANVCFASNQTPEAGSIAAETIIETDPIADFDVEELNFAVPENGSIAGIQIDEEKFIYLARRRGCCSHHRGVCDCDGNRLVCCDGSYSPTCTC